MGFITLTELKSFPAPVTDKQWEKVNDTQLASAIETATEDVENWLDRKIASASYTERIIGSGRHTIMVEHYPIISLTSLSSRDYVETVATYGTGSFLIHNNAGIIEWIDKLRNQYWKNYIWVVTYVAGYATIPRTIKHATILQTLQLLQPAFRGSTTFAQTNLTGGDLNEDIVDLLEKWKRKRLG